VRRSWARPRSRHYSGSAVPELMIETHRGIAAIEDEWEELAERTGAPLFHRAGWIAAWWEAFGRGGLEIAAAREPGGRLAAVLPVLTRGPVIQSPTNWHTPVFGPVAQDAESIAAVLRWLLRRRRCWVDLSLVDSRDPLARVLPALSAELGTRTTVRSVLRSPYIELRGTWEEYEASLSREVRRQARKRWRRLEREGRLEARFSAGGAQLDDLLTEGFGIEGSGWKDERGTSIRSSPATERFYRRVSHWAAAHGWLQLGELRLDGRCLAFMLNFEQGGSVYTLKAGFDTEYARFAPGTLLTRASIAYAFETGLACYEFLGAASDYKLHWTRTVRERLRLQAFPRSPVGTAGFVTWRYARPLARRARALVRSSDQAGAAGLRSCSAATTASARE
jgi:CelD/BcsL family acetyltransferase involved in cellulose biosynthesis